MTIFRESLVDLFTKDLEVKALVLAVMPVAATITTSDGLSVSAHAILRGIGQQHIGGYANLVGHYLLSMPLAFGAAFGLGWKLKGLWLGLMCGLIL